MVYSGSQCDILLKLGQVLTNPEEWESSLSGTGPIYDLEEKFKRLAGHRYALSMANATLALWQVFEALNIHNTEVICSPLTWGSMLTGALLAHNELIFADVDEQSLNPTVTTIRLLIGKHTRALLLNDTFGYPSVGPELQQLAHEYGWVIIQDCSASFGAWIHDRHTGAFADVAVFSLGPGKTLSGSEGAVVVTSKNQLYEKLVEQTQHPQRIRRDVPWAMNQFALNCRISAVGAAIASSSFYPTMRFLIRQRSHWLTVLKELNILGLTDTLPPPAEISPSYSTFTFALNPKNDKEFSRWLAEQKGQYRIVPSPVCQPIYQDAYFKKHYPQKNKPNCPVAEVQSRRRVQLIFSNHEEVIPL
jgi:dTDP-4-amino-4,6-dideoxygalactose transaminase